MSQALGTLHFLGIKIHRLYKKAKTLVHWIRFRSHFDRWMSTELHVQTQIVQMLVPLRLEHVFYSNHLGAFQFRWSQKDKFSIIGVLLYVWVVFVYVRQKNWFNWQNRQLSSLVSVSNETVTIDPHPMHLVHSIQYQPCTACIGCASIITVLLPIMTKVFSVAV